MCDESKPTLNTMNFEQTTGEVVLNPKETAEASKTAPIDGLVEFRRVGKESVVPGETESDHDNVVFALLKLTQIRGLAVKCPPGLRE